MRQVWYLTRETMRDMNRSVTFTLTADDYVAANKLFILKYSTSGWPLVCWLIFVALLLASLFTLALRFPDAPFMSLFYICVVVVIAIPLYQYFSALPCLPARPTQTRKPFSTQSRLHGLRKALGARHSRATGMFLGTTISNGPKTAR